MKKYVRVVMGFFVIAIFLSPLAAIFRGDVDYMNNILPPENLEREWQEIKRKGEEIQQDNDNILSGYYSDKIAGRIENIINIDFPGLNKEINVGVSDEYELKNVEIRLYDRQIKQVEINEVAPEGEEEAGGQKDRKDEQIIKLKNRIVETFQIAPEKVKIYYYAGGEMVANY